MKYIKVESITILIKKTIIYNMIKYPLIHSSWNKLEIKALNKVVKTGLFTMGKNTKNFEGEFSKYLKKKYSVMVNSGSSANLIAIASLFYKKKILLKLVMKF